MAATSSVATRPINRAMWNIESNRQKEYTTTCVIPRIMRLRYSVIMKADEAIAIIAFHPKSAKRSFGKMCEAIAMNW